MFPFNLLFEKAKTKKPNLKYFEPVFENKTEIKNILQNLPRCPHCHFLIFDNYWSGDLENVNVKLCPTCGEKKDRKSVV